MKAFKNVLLNLLVNARNEGKKEEAVAYADAKQKKIVRGRFLLDKSYSEFEQELN